MYKPRPSQAAIEALAGHHFPGGNYRVAHWENVLLTGCTGSDLMADGMVHPIALFHLPITGSGTSIAQMFDLGQAESDLAIMIESYDWEFFQPLREDQGQRYADCDICLEHKARGILLQGTATVRLP